VVRASDATGAPPHVRRASRAVGPPRGPVESRQPPAESGGDDRPAPASAPPLS